MAYIEGNYSQYVGDMGTFDNFDPLLVNLHDSLRVYRGDKTNIDSHNGLIEAVVDLLDANLSAREKTLAAEVLIGLIKQAEMNMRQSLAVKLAPRDDLPTALLHYIAYEEIALAEPVLVQSPQLSDIDLVYIIQAKEEEHWQAIARRNDLSGRVITELLNKTDERTVAQLLDNKYIKLEDEMLGQIAELVSISPSIADKFVHYKGLSRQLAVEIYWHVTVSLRQEIGKRFDIADREIDQALEDCIQDFTDTMLQVDKMRPSQLMIEVASYYGTDNRITGSILANALRRRQGRFFAAMFAELTGLTTKVIVDMMKQVGGQGLAVASRAKNISKEDFVSIFLLSRTIVRSKQAVDARELNMAIRYYDSLTIKMANEILEDSLTEAA